MNSCQVEQVNKAPELGDFPDEILDKIFSHLLNPREKQRLLLDWLGHIFQVRAVCRRWNNIASVHLLHTLPLWHTEITINDKFRAWHKLIDSLRVRDAARRVVIDTVAHSNHFLSDECLVHKWPQSWKEGEWPEFLSAISLTRHLPNLDAIEVRFSAACTGPEGELEGRHLSRFTGLEITEPAETRLYTLEAVAKAMIERTKRHQSLRLVEELVLENLQNMRLNRDLVKYVSSEHLKRLHIKVTHEGGSTIEKRKKKQFNNLPAGNNLVELTLSGEYWGAIPGEFNGGKLSFPTLKTLTLEGFEILRQDQFDWILRIRSLTRLHLHCCPIITHCLVFQPEFDYWNVNLQGWKRVQDANYDPATHPDRYKVPHEPDLDALEPGWYVNPLRWNTLFDSICENLPLLEDFTFDAQRWANYFRHIENPFNEDMMTFRYVGFAHKRRCLQSVSLYLDETMDECNYVQDDMLGKPKEIIKVAEPADRQALDKLLQTIQERRNGKHASVEDDNPRDLKRIRYN
ncbi:hypothetical protein FPOAC1_007809 [Fusarium poae]|uniref:hypothetical protein n=1 Tax=Fusarium poae TaxID=36050 RepID=UPI001CE92487|nr:hypothetical protein FPOAC1_007809 [Fusarium poae]KAG8668430.1 hypothetical protein FPOAC1_007809 [Fusarium poae]